MAHTLAHLAANSAHVAGGPVWAPITDPPTPRRLQGPFIRAVGAILPEATWQDQRRYLRQRRQLNSDLNMAARLRVERLERQRQKEKKINDCRAWQARRRALKIQLPALFRAHGFYRPEIVRHVLSYVGFDLPAAETAALFAKVGAGGLLW